MNRLTGILLSVAHGISFFVVERLALMNKTLRVLSAHIPKDFSEH